MFTPVLTQLAQLWMAQFRLMRPRWLIVLLDSTSRELITFSFNFQKTFPLKYSDPSSLIEIVWNTENKKCILGNLGKISGPFFPSLFFLSLAMLMGITYLLLRIPNILDEGLTNFARSVFRYLLLDDLLKQFKASFFGMCLEVLALLNCSILTSSHHS